MVSSYLFWPIHMFAQATAACLSSTGAKSGTYQTGQCNTGLPRAAATSGNLQTLLQIIFAVAGALAVVMIVLGGLKFITAQGEPSGVAQARKILVYALVGLIFALFAEAIVTFVLGKF